MTLRFFWQALLTTAIVLVTIAVLRRIPFTAPFVQMALQ